MVLNTILNFIFAPIIGLNPALAIFIISFLVSILMIIVNKKTLWSKEAKQIHEKIKKSQEMRTEVLKAQKSGDMKKADDLMKKSLEIQSKHFSEYMKYSVKPIIISIFLAVLILPWLNSTYGKVAVAVLPNELPIVGGKTLSWLWWYILCSIAISIIGRKIVGD